MFFYSALVLAWMCTLFLGTDSEERIWGRIDAPDNTYQVILYQKERIMHQAPEILVYYQNKGKKMRYPIGNILLPDDNRSALSYEYEWTTNQELLLKLNCEKCMIDQRIYSVLFHRDQTYRITPVLKTHPIL